MATLTLRAAAVSDAAALTALARRAKATWGYPTAWLDAWERDLAITPELIASHWVLVAERDGELAGMIALFVADGRASIEHAWIAPEHQRAGVGARLVTAALLEGAARGAREVTVESDPHAAGFYEGLGARRRGVLAAPMPGAPDRTLPVLVFDLERNASA